MQTCGQTDSIPKLYRWHHAVCIIYYRYDRQHNNKPGYLRVKTKAGIDMCLTYLI
jgi:hypothetical protein